MTTTPFYIGTYTSGVSKGIYRSELNLADGTLSPPQLVAEVANPTFLAIHPALDVLYSSSEVRQDGKRQNARIVSFKIGSNGGLQELKSQPTGGDGPCFVSTDRAAKFAFVANYGSGSISAYSLGTAGELLARVSHVQHTGKGVHPTRQEGPHAHCILVDPSDNYVCAVDLGLDQILIYALDRRAGALTNTGRPFKATPGFGPRHLAFHPNGKHAFVIHELASKLSSCHWDSLAGTLTELQHLSTLPSDFTDPSITAEVLVHPNGKFVYGSNRGHDSVAVLRFEESSGLLTLVGHTSTLGKTPRNFRIDPSGAFLLVENQDSDSIYSFKIDPQNGTLEQVGEPIHVGMPCCIKFYE
ncbi:MAG: lactonase family protein [Pirellulaceae bacterium]|nr:lactonase family protein [Pirellulaceae bacterium]